MLPADSGSGGPIGVDAELADTGSTVTLGRVDLVGGEISRSLRIDLKGADIAGVPEGCSFFFSLEKVCNMM